MTARDDIVDALVKALRSAACPGGGWNKDMMVATVADCLGAGVCRCDLGDAVRKAETSGQSSPDNGSRPLPFSRDELGRMVREAWVRWAQTQPNPKASWLLPYDELSEPDREADRQIGETISRWTLIGDASRNALSSGQGS